MWFTEDLYLYVDSSESEFMVVYQISVCLFVSECVCNCNCQCVRGCVCSECVHIPQLVRVYGYVSLRVGGYASFQTWV